MAQQNLQLSKLWFAIVFISIIGLLQSCKKDSTDYQISYTSTGSKNLDWVSDKVTAIIRNDSLLVSGQQKNKSSIGLIVSSSAVGNYQMSVSDLKTVLAINIDGSKDKSAQYISVEGVISIIEKNEDKKIITGTFDVSVMNLVDINYREKIQGSFTSKYTSY